MKDEREKERERERERCTVNYPRVNWLGSGFDQILILTNLLRASMLAIACAKLLFRTAVPQL